MEVVGAVVVALLGACVGVLLGLYLQGAQRNRIAEQQQTATLVHAEQAEQQRAAARALAEKQHTELRGHLMTMTAALVDRMQLVGAGLAAELRAVNAEHRNDLRLAIGLSRTSAPGEEPPPTRPTSPPPRPLPRPTPPPRPTISTSPIALAHSGPTPRCTSDEPTPPSGWTLEDVRSHTASTGEERST